MALFLRQKVVSSDKIFGGGLPSFSWLSRALL